MTIGYSRNFIKQAKKLSPQLRQSLHARLTIFVQNPLHPLLRNHSLRGKYKDYRSIDITGDVRALYLHRSSEVIFDAVGTHSQLYG